MSKIGFIAALSALLFNMKQEGESARRRYFSGVSGNVSFPLHSTNRDKSRHRNLKHRANIRRKRRDSDA